jgi:hypothetical protein
VFVRANMVAVRLPLSNRLGVMAVVAAPGMMRPS